MKGRLRVHVEHCFEPDPEAVRRAIVALLRFSDEARAVAESSVAPKPESA